MLFRSNAPKLMDSLGEESKAFLKRLTDILEAEGIDYRINPRLVRGLDYYNLTVFEWVTDKLGAQSTVCGGGRYDPLIGMLGGKETPACGFAMGIERIIELMKEEGIAPSYKECSVYVAWSGEDSFLFALRTAEALRNKQISTILHSGSAKFANQMKRANASGADFAVIIGESETQEKMVSIKPLRENLKDYGQQLKMTVEQAVEYLAEQTR